MTRRISGLIAFTLALSIGTCFVRANGLSPSLDGFGQPQIGSINGLVPVLKEVQIIDFGKVIYVGPMDVNPTLARIRAGRKLNHPNDGAIHGNRERHLPVKSDRAYYREFVHTTHSPKFPGPQRIVIGTKGEVYYTGDHYAHFVRVNP